MLSITEPDNHLSGFLADLAPNYYFSHMMRQSPRKKKELIPPPIKKTDSIEEFPADNEEEKRTEKKPTIAKKISINSENFVMCKANSFDRDYSILAKIGEGCFGSVYRVQHKLLKLERALKIIKKKKNEHFSSFEEIDVLKKMDHSNILKIFEFYELEENYYLITDLFDGVELFDFVVE